jgi:hypothetical protein
MTTAQLFKEKDLLAFLQAQIRPADNDPWFFAQVPETIPYAVRQRFADILQPDATISVGGGEDNLDYDRRMSLALERFEQSAEFRRCRFVSGHFKVFQIDGAQGLAKVRLMTVMRDPLNRLLSDFAAQGGGKRGRLTPEAFLEFAKNPANQNVFLQFLCPKHIWKPNECIEFIQDRFDFIGIAEDLPMTLKMFYAVHGAQFFGLAKETEHDARRFNRADLSANLIRTVSLLNAVDYDIFRYFHDQFVSLKDDFFAMSDRGDIFKTLKFRP